MHMKKYEEEWPLQSLGGEKNDIALTTINLYLHTSKN